MNPVQGVLLIALILYIKGRDGAESALITGAGLAALFFAMDHNVPWWVALPMCLWLGNISYNARLIKEEKPDE